MPRIWSDDLSAVEKRSRIRTRLGVEALEHRDLLSASATLVAGNGDLVNLDSNGILWETASTGSKVEIDSQVQAIGVAGDGSVVDLNYGGRLYKQTTPRSFGAWGLIDSNVQTIAVAGNGDVVGLHTDGRVYEQNAATPSPTAWTQIDSGVEATVEAQDGSIVDLSSHRLFKQTAPRDVSAWAQIDSNVQAVSVASNGKIIDLNNGGNLFIQSRVSPALGGWTQIDSSVQTAVLAANGDLVDLSVSGKVYEQNAATPSLTSWTQIDSGVQAIGVAGSGALIDFSNGRLFAQTAPRSMSAWTQIDSSVQAFTVAANGDLVDLSVSGNVYEQNAATPSLTSWTQIDSGVQAIGVAGSGALIDFSNGRLFAQTAPRSMSAWVQVDSSVQAFEVAPNGDLIDLSVSGNVYEQNAATPSLTSWTQIDSGVQAIGVAADGSVLDFSNGRVFAQTAPRSMSAWALVNSGVTATAFLSQVSTRAVGIWTHAQQIPFDAIGRQWHAAAAAGIDLGSPQGDEQFADGSGIADFQNGAVVVSAGVAASILDSPVTIKALLDQSQTIVPTADPAHPGQSDLIVLKSNGQLLALGLFGEADLLAGVQSVTPYPPASVTIQVGPYLTGHLSLQIDPTYGYLGFTLANAQINIGAFISGYLDPVVSEVQKITKPLEPAAEFLLGPVPIISTISTDFGGPQVTVANLVAAITGSASVGTFASAIEAINNLDPNLAATGSYSLGGFTTTAAGGIGSIVTQNLIQEIGGSLGTSLQRIQTAGLAFSVLTDSTNFFRAILGQNVTLFTYALPQVSIINFDYHQLLVAIPTAVPGIYVDAYADETFNIQAGATIGVDTSGLLSGAPSLGFYVQNARLSVAVGFSLTGTVNAAGVLTANLAGTVTVNISATLQGADAGGKVYGSDIVAGRSYIGVAGSVTGNFDLSVSITYVDPVKIWNDFWSWSWGSITTTSTYTILHTPQTTYSTFG